MAKRWLPEPYRVPHGVGLAACNALTGIGELALDDGVPDGAPESSSLADGRRDDVTDQGRPMAATTRTTSTRASSPTSTPPSSMGAARRVASPFRVPARRVRAERRQLPENLAPRPSSSATRPSPARRARGCSITAQPKLPGPGAPASSPRRSRPTWGGAPVWGTTAARSAAAATADGFMGPFNAGTTARRYVPPERRPDGRHMQRDREQGHHEADPDEEPDLPGDRHPAVRFAGVPARARGPVQRPDHRNGRRGHVSGRVPQRQDGRHQGRLHVRGQLRVQRHRQLQRRRPQLTTTPPAPAAWTSRSP